MLIQYIHHKDTNQTAVKALSHQLQQYFNVTDYRVNVGWIHSRTRSEQGYNIRSVKGTERYYLHTGKDKAELKTGELVFFNYTDSKHCEDRLDLVAHCSLEEFFDTKNTALISSFLDFFYVIFSYATKADVYTKQLDQVCTLLLKQQYEDAVYQNIFANRSLLNTLILEHRALSNSYAHAYLLKAEEELPESLLIRFLKQNVDRPKDLDFLVKYAAHKGFKKLNFAIKLVIGHSLDVNEINDLQLEVQYSFLNEYIPKHPLWREMVLAHPATLYNDAIAEKFIAELPQDKTQWYNTLLQFPLNIQNDLANKLAEDNFEYVYQLISDEQRYIHHIMQCIQHSYYENFANYYEFSKQRNFHHVFCILKIIEYKILNKPIKVYELNKIIENYVDGLFKTNSQDNLLTKIDFTIFSGCTYMPESYGKENTVNIYKNANPDAKFYPTPSVLQPLSFCEGGIWFKDKEVQYKEINGGKINLELLTEDERKTLKDDEIVKEVVKERNVLCRRHACQHCTTDTLESSVFYQLLRKVDFDPLVLHDGRKDNNQVIRRIAGINRWNEIIDRLTCRTCNSNFSVSEHTKFSIGKMAYSASYWHCSNENCHEFTHVVKITHCLACMSVIDSRDSHFSCNPYETLSFKKFYLCKNCAGCCWEHGFKGTCPSCGLEDAYPNLTEENRTKAQCKGCGEKVSIKKRLFQNYMLKKNLPPKLVKYEDQTVITEFKNGVQKLYVYDLYNALTSKRMQFSRLKNFDFIIDVKILYKMAFLGLDHKQYKNILPDDQIPVQLEQDAVNVDMVTLEKLKELADKALSRPYFHQLYKMIELPFALALYQYAQTGLYLPSKRIKAFAEKIEHARNAINFKVQNEVGVFASDQNEVKKYLEDKYHHQLLLEINSERDFESIIKRQKDDLIVQQLQMLDKINRAGSVISEFSRLNSEIVHPEYQIIGTVTGRCTAKKPAILSFPKVFRSIFAGIPDHQLYSFDYGQIELGILAGLSQDEQLIADYNESDIYQELADETDLTRDNAKIFFLGLLYGITDQNLIKMMGISQGEILEIRQRLMVRYPKIEELRQRCISFGQQHGFINNMFGLHRATIESRNKSPYVQNWEKNWFFNFPIQSTAAGVFKKALIHIFESDTKKTMKMVCPLYDEFLVQIPNADRAYYIALIRTAMITALSETFPQLIPKVDLQVYEDEGVDEFNTHAWLAWFEQFNVKPMQQVVYHHDPDLPF
ncbi:DNA polymerase [Acinetobacter sp. GXMZU3951]